MIKLTPNSLFSIAVDAPLPTPLSYSLPENIKQLQRGQAVRVPLGKRSVDGVVLGPCTKEKEVDFKIKPIESIVSDYLPLPEATLSWLEWLSKYYFYPLGQVVSLCFPPLKKKGKGSQKSSPIPQAIPEAPPELTYEQAQVLNSIEKNKNFSANLIYGITGSGKTEVYLRLIANTLKNNKKTLVLVPEISLTPQLLCRFSSRFPDQLAVLHSHLTEREKTDQWWSIIDGHKKILVGARSALFCPIPDLGLIVIDEEHEPSFKQDEMLKYHARDAAVMLAHFHGCPIVLGSATPSLESWHNTQQGKYKLHKMKQRVANRKMPHIKVIDMRSEREKRRNHETKNEVTLPFWLSQDLFNGLVDCFHKGDQAALFLNRRGVAQFVLCFSCGFTYECPNCSISLTLHGKNYLVCHYCDYSERFEEKCPNCGSIEIGPLGLGTELLERDVKRLFPKIHVARADRDEIQNREDLEKLIFDFEKGQTNLLIGTQMIAKGLDFKGLNLVGLVMADVGFNLPDFRATERSFQLLTQVSGRAGRHSELPGQVIIQTYSPEHTSIQYSCKNDYPGFARAELDTRRSLNYPPFSRLSSFRILGNNHEKTLNIAQLLGKRLHYLQQKQKAYANSLILGPAPAPISKLRGKYRFQILIKGPDHPRIAGLCRQALGDKKWIPSGVKVIIDIGPVNLL